MDAPSPPILDQLLAQSGWLRRLAQRLVQDPDHAEEIVQGTWLRALESPPSTLQSARSWLARVARNLVLERGRADAARRGREQRQPPPEDAPSSAEIVEAAQQHRLLVETVMELEEPYRSTVLLVFFEGRSAAAIAAAEGVPASTVRNRVRRALAQLRERLDARAHGERTQWRLALAPLAGRSLTTGLTTGLTTASTLKIGTAIGILVMSTTAKLATALLIVLAAMLTFVWRGGESAPTDTVTTSPADPGPRPAGPMLADPAEDGLAADKALRVPVQEPLVAGEPVAPELPVDEAEPEPEPIARGLLVIEVRKEGAPVQSGRVLLLAQKVSPPWLPRDAQKRESVSRFTPLDRAGQVRFNGVDPGLRTVGVEMADGLVHQAFVRVRESEGARFVFELGTASLHGHVYSPTGEPVAGARIQFHVDQVITILWTDALGAYRVESLHAGSCRVSVGFNGRQDPSGGEFMLRLRLAQGESRELDFGKPGGWPIWRGTVRARDGEPVVNFGAPFHPGELHFVRSSDGNYSHLRYADDGTFEVRLEPGIYSVRITGPANRSDRPLVDDALELTADGLERDITRPGTSITGTVRLSSGEAGWGGSIKLPSYATVSAEEVSTIKWMGRLAEDGSFRVDGITPGTWWLCSGSGAERATVQFTVYETDIVLSLDLTLK